jgi:hypothetical protein
VSGTKQANTVKNGDFFTTTGEVLIYSFSMDTTGVNADLEWTFPLSFPEIICGESDEVKRHTIYLPDTKEFGRQRYIWNLYLSEANWVRFEAWDIARNVAFTQAFWLKTPVPRGELVKNFTLINADTDAPVPVYDPIPDNAHINLSTLPTRNLNIRGNTNPWLVGSVQFGLDENDTYCIENSWPYALASDDNQSYNAWTPAPRTHTLTATPYSDTGAGGTTGKSRSISFTIIDILKGDVNEDLRLDIVDALLTARYYVGLDPQGFPVDSADVNCNGTSDIVDALLIAQYFVGLITEFC